jgi:hypothetical protein
MGVLLCVVAFVAAYLAGRISLGRGVAAVLVVGYFYGILRARFLDGFSHFSFDCALLGLYLARISLPHRDAFPSSVAAVLGWLIILVGWPLVVLATGFVHDQHAFIQIVGLRAAIWMLPCLWLGATLLPDDLRTVSRALAVLNLAVLPFAIGEYLRGIEPFFPRSAVTEIMYKSKDIAGFTYYRIPGTFSSSAAYGGVMVATVPFLFGLINAAGRSVRDRLLAFGGLLAASYGVFACGSRSPVAHLILLIVPALFVMRRQLGIFGLTVVLVGLVAVVIGKDPRLQRYKSLEDPDQVLARLEGSANANILDLVGRYPLGVGLGGAAGTSTPSFLLHLAKKQIGAENEYIRLGLELGVVGLLLWLAFLFWYFFRRRSFPSAEWRLGCTLMYFYSAICWATAFIGTGLLTSIPGTMLLLLEMGCVSRSPISSPPQPFAPVPPVVEPRREGAFA